MADEDARPKDGELLRELGLHELFYETMSGRFDASYYFQYAVLNSNFPLSKEDIEESLKVLINFQPFLRVKVVGRIEKDRAPTKKTPNNERLYYSPCSYELSDVLKFRTRASSDDLLDMIREEEDVLSTDEDSNNRPRWRVVFNMPTEDVCRVGTECMTSPGKYRYEMLFRMHHQFSDAVSGYDIVYRQFLPILNRIVNRMQVDEIFLRPLDLTPTYEEDIMGVKNSADWNPAWYVKSGLGLLRAKNRLTKRSGPFSPIYSEGAPFEEAVGVGVFKYSFSEELTQKILHERKEKGITVHSILLTAFSFGIIKLMQERGLALPSKIKSGWPIDSRKKLKKYGSPQPLGMFIGTSGLTSMKVPKPYRMDRDIFWRNAKEMGTQVQKAVRHQRENITLHAMAYMTECLQHKSLDRFLSELGLDQHLGISNLGKCAAGSDLVTSMPKSVDAEEIYFGLLGSGSACVLSTFFNTVINHKGKLFCLLLFGRRWVKEDLPERLVKYTEEVLHDVCDSPHPDSV